MGETERSELEDRAIRKLTKALRVRAPVVLKGNKHLLCEHWQELGAAMGLSARVDHSAFINFGGVEGWEAHVSIVNDQTGVIIGGGDGMCVSDEPRYKSMSAFQRRSMAQTRATSRAFRILLGHLAIRAGFAGTPAEELDGLDGGEGERREERRGPLPKRITMAQRQQFIAAMNEGGHTIEEVKKYLSQKGIHGTHMIPTDQFDALVARMKEPEPLFEGVD